MSKRVACVAYVASVALSGDTISSFKQITKLHNHTIAHNNNDNKIMPHATVPGSSPPVEDAIMSDALPEETQQNASSTEDANAQEHSQTPAVEDPAGNSLDDIFDDDDDDDDEFASSAPVKAEESSQEDQCVHQ